MRKSGQGEKAERKGREGERKGGEGEGKEGSREGGREKERRDSRDKYFQKGERLLISL